MMKRLTSLSVEFFLNIDELRRVPTIGPDYPRTNKKSLYDHFDLPWWWLLPSAYSAKNIHFFSLKWNSRPQSRSPVAISSGS